MPTVATVVQDLKKLQAQGRFVPGNLLRLRGYMLRAWESKNIRGETGMFVRGGTCGVLLTAEAVAAPSTQVRLQLLINDRLLWFSQNVNHLDLIWSIEDAPGVRPSEGEVGHRSEP